ncbi:hypothetical protein EYF80_029908 [Liparis tanakae]|uniref:Uncharacterized protein n=1 Tax=Liparis tanakae TaxID=230148 RepID=A0A4Z2H264_9TELE|nr:hypothetical protein EYF80_029908 [Liparis tanakae]
METGFQVVLGAALGCQLVPPVILFSPGWLQCIGEAVAARCVGSKNGFKVHLESPCRLLGGALWRRVPFMGDDRRRAQ